MGVEAGSRRRYRDTPGADPKRLQRLLSLPSADNRALGGRPAGVVANGEGDSKNDDVEATVCMPTSASGITAAVLHVRRQVWALSILRCHWYARELLAADAGDEQISALKIR